MSHIPKGVWGRKARLAWGFVLYAKAKGRVRWRSLFTEPLAKLLARRAKRSNIVANDSKREYERGYHDGREGKSFQTPGALEVVAGAVVPGIDPVGNQKDYGQGYKDGKEDKKR